MTDKACLLSPPRRIFSVVVWCTDNSMRSTPNTWDYSILNQFEFTMKIIFLPYLECLGTWKDRSASRNPTHAL